MQAGVEMGIKPQDAMKMLAQTLEGAAQLLLSNEQTHPALEIEKVTTPGGITIKGVNELEMAGFSALPLSGHSRPVYKYGSAESFPGPLHAAPAFDEDERTDVLIKQEGTPHADQSPSPVNAEQITETD